MRSLAVVAVILVGSACHPPRPAPPAVAPPTNAVETAAKQREAMLAREQTPQPRHVVASNDRAVELIVEGAAPPTLTPMQGGFQLTIPMGTNSPISCIVAPSLDLASTLDKQINALLAPFPKRQIVAAEAGELNGTAFLSVEHFYFIESKKALGHLKVLVAGGIDRGAFVCIHDEGGYRKTLRRVATQLVETLSFKRTGPPLVPLCRTIIVATIDGRPIGVESASTLREEGGTKRISMMAELTASPTGELRGSDAYELEIFRDGLLDEGLYVKNDGQEILHWNLKLRRERPATYVVEGTHQGKPIAGRFEATDLSAPERVRAETRKSILGQRGGEVRWRGYAPSSDPLVPRQQAIRATSDGKYELDLNGMSVPVELDESGDIRSAVARKGPRVLEIKRVFAAGTCP